MSICISENLRILRQKNDYTFEQLAEIIDVSRQTIAKWESGETLPDIVNCVKLATLFKVSLDEFVTMPIKDMGNDVNSDDKNGRVMGVVDVGGEGQINIPDSVLKIFDIQQLSEKCYLQSLKTIFTFFENWDLEYFHVQSLLFFG